MGCRWQIGRAKLCASLAYIGLGPQLSNNDKSDRLLIPANEHVIVTKLLVPIVFIVLLIAPGRYRDLTVWMG